MVKNYRCRHCGRIAVGTGPHVLLPHARTAHPSEWGRSKYPRLSTTVQAEIVKTFGEEALYEIAATHELDSICRRLTRNIQARDFAAAATAARTGKAIGRPENARATALYVMERRRQEFIDWCHKKAGNIDIS